MGEPRDEGRNRGLERRLRRGTGRSRPGPLCRGDRRRQGAGSIGREAVSRPLLLAANRSDGHAAKQVVVRRGSGLKRQQFIGPRHSSGAHSVVLSAAKDLMPYPPVPLAIAMRSFAALRMTRGATGVARSDELEPNGLYIRNTPFPSACLSNSL